MPISRKQALDACYVIPGWCFPRELGAIYDLVLGSHLHVEIGSFCGRSMYAAVTSLAEGGKAVSIDPLEFSYPSESFPLPSADWPAAVWDATCRSLRQVRPDVEIKHIGKPSLDAAVTFNESIDTLYHDGDHNYAEVLAELEAWYPKVRPGGKIFGHDYWAIHPGVIEAVEEFFGKRNLNFEVISQTRLWLHHKP